MGWEPWIRTFVPPVFVQAALDAWLGLDEENTEGPPGLGCLDGEVQASLHAGTNIEQWCAASSSQRSESLLSIQTSLGKAEVNANGKDVICVSLWLKDNIPPDSVCV